MGYRRDLGKLRSKANALDSIIKREDRLIKHACLKNLYFIFRCTKKKNLYFIGSISNNVAWNLM